jgi:hypothetical protein
MMKHNLLNLFLFYFTILMVKTKKKSTFKKGKTIKPKKSNKVKVLIVKRNPELTEKMMKDKEGRYFDAKDYDKIINYNCDCYYYDEKGNKKILIKFRKKVFPEKLCNAALDNLTKAAMKHHDNRGAAAGVLDIKKLPSYANDPSKFIKRTNLRISGYISKKNGKLVKNTIGNLAQSNIIGYYDKKDRNIGVNAPQCRETAFTSQQVDKWTKVIPFIEAINEQFKKLIPKNHKLQLNRARLTPKFAIKNTAFSTLTINYNWRTALHKDAGDFVDGFGNLIVCEKGRYKGGYTGFPQFGIAVDVRHGDFLAMDVHEWHCNTKLIPIDKDFTRLSLVAYLREQMIKCKHL